MTARSVIRPTARSTLPLVDLCRNAGVAPGWSIREPISATQALREISGVDAVVFTHSHTDHIMGSTICVVIPTISVDPVYASAETMRDLARVYELASMGLNRFPGYLVRCRTSSTGRFDDLEKRRSRVASCPRKINGERLSVIRAREKNWSRI